ncbi:MAG TPA: universal stress protein [Armatimonadota bacterium]|jgi:nucleotide-binding universal stress UspA family protein
MRILVATDGSECSYEAARQLIKLIRSARHHITAVHVMPSFNVGVDTAFIESDMEREGIAVLNTVRHIFSSVAIDIETELLSGNPAEVIVQTAHEGKYDLIVIGHAGQGDFREYMLGSVSKSVLQNAHCAVLVVK